MYELMYMILLFLWVIFVVLFISKGCYNIVAKHYGHRSGVYFARKVIHALTGGVVALLLPYLFKTPILPFIASLLLALLTYLPHKREKLMYWFQLKENMYEVDFCIVWGLVVVLSWLIDNTFWLGILPLAFMSFGDGITGIVRNFVYKKRTKAWLGNLAMALFCVPLGFATKGMAGALAGLVASIVEHYDFVDDNISVPLSAFMLLLLFQLLPSSYSASF